MVTKEIIEYIKAEVHKGVPRETILANLISTSTWTKSDVEEAFTHIDTEKPASPVSTEAEPKKSTIDKMIASAFKTKASSFGWILIVSLVISLLTSSIESSVLPTFGPLTFLIVWLIVILFLRSRGHKNESKNILKALGTILLVLIILGIIGFGICLLIFSGWNN